MGRLETISLSSLRPTQDYLYEKTIERYMRAFARGVEAVVTVREPFDDLYDLIDGHHAAAAAHLAGKDAALAWIADGPRDVPCCEDLIGTAQYEKYEQFCDEIARRHMASFGYVPMRDGSEITSISELVRYTA